MGYQNDAQKRDETSDLLAPCEGLFDQNRTSPACNDGGQEGDDGCFCKGQILERIIYAEYCKMGG